MDPLSALTIASAVVQFAEQGAHVFITLFHYYRKVKHAPQLSKELQREAQLLSEVLDKLKYEFEATPTNIQSAATNTFCDIVDEFTITMKEMSIRLDAIQKNKVTKMFKWPFTQKLNEQYIAKFQRYHAIFALALETIQMYRSSYLFSHLFRRQTRRSTESIEQIATGIKNLKEIALGKIGKSITNVKQNLLETNAKVLMWFSFSKVF